MSSLHWNWGGNKSWFHLSDPISLIAKGESSWMKASASVGKITCSEGLERGKGKEGRRREEE